MVGHIKILEVNKCTSKNCNCGWNLTIGGTDLEDLEQIFKSIKKHNLLWAELLTESD